jgi:ABC-type uncharacterized transport system ATPase subunit
VLGSNGAGTTTAVRILATLLRPDGGAPPGGGLDVVRQAARVRRLAGLSGCRSDRRLTGVVLDAEHTCMTVRGVQAVGTRTITSALHGVLREDPRSRAEFFALTAVHH